MSTTTEIAALPYNACTVSPITSDGGRFYWTSYQLASDEDGTRIECTAYRTDSRGEGLWVWQPTGGTWVDNQGHVVSQEFEWNQVLGHAQFNLNCSSSTRRERILGAVGYGQRDEQTGERITARADYARTPRIPSALLK